MRAGKISDLKKIKKLSKNYLNNIFNDLDLKTASDFIQKNGGDFYVKKPHLFLEALKYPFVEMPFEILDNVSKKFKLDNIYNSNTLVKFRKQRELKENERALRGLIENGKAFLDDAKGNTQNAAGEFYRLFDENLAPGNAKYNTTHERFIARMVSGITPAIMLGNDFYNKSIKNGKPPEDATKEAINKRRQEIIATSEEAVSQYFMLSAFSGFVNNSQFGAPIVNALLGLGFHITSRLSTGRPLTRIKLSGDQLKLHRVSIDNFVNKAKNIEPEENNKKNDKEEKKDKKHLLSAKNIALACLLSVAAGFGLRKIKSTKAFKKLSESICDTKPVKALLEKYKKATVGELWVSDDELEAFFKTNEACGYSGVWSNFIDRIYKMDKKNRLDMVGGKTLIGEYEKFTKIPFTNIKISKKELYMMPFAPFKIVKEIVGYPYKLVSSALEGLKIIKKPKSNELKNDFYLVNTILDFREQAKKFDNNIESKEFIKHYKKHIEKNRLNALNRETKSNVNNCDIGKLTALFGVFASIYFATTDDYNSTLKQTGDIDRANKDARLRGINKIVRTSVQNVTLGINNLFKIPYSQSLTGAGIITAGVTLLTDNISRVLSGMPARKMNKEKLEKYYENQKNGALKGYYGALDKLTD